MTDIDRLNAAILANPADDDLRMVYADKIQERDRPGDVERAEFIRVQVAIARHNPKDCNQGLCRTAGYGPCAACRKLDALRERERELFLHCFQKSRHLFGDCNITYCLPNSAFARREATTDEPIAIVSRGFIAEVRAPLAALVGGECGRCAHYGNAGRIYSGIDEMPWTNCPACTDGHVPAVLPAIAQAHPLEWVRATDAIHEDERFPGGHRINREEFPRELWLGLISRAALSFKDITPPDANAIMGTREELEELLSRALIAWARKEQPCRT